ITVFESAPRIGGHTNTVDVNFARRRYAVDTGFIVFNNRTYPNFIALLDELGVESQPSNMGFSVRNEQTGLEYSGSNLKTLFAQRRNLLRPSFHGMLRDILRFNREATSVLAPNAPGLTLGQFLDSRGYSKTFRDNYILPMGGAIWSSVPEQMNAMPAKFFVRFFDNHGLLSIKDRPTWRVIRNGSRSYVDKLIAGHLDRIHLNTAVEKISRFPTHVEIKARNAEPQRFDYVFIATHSDQALRMLAEPSHAEREVLGVMAYQDNEAVLHTDTRLMPRKRRAWAAWNYHILPHETDRVAVTYNMNILQGIEAPAQFCVTLNNTQAIDPEKVIETFSYSHPVFTREAVDAQRRHGDIDGLHRTYFCGAYWCYGFHEDGVVSALNALDHFQQRTGSAQRNLQRAG
ncbi:MAG: FAD-dependent oxidoreductase, partial [Gammaproteobacteria bacterium]|nr:FAD-dependent oxidoreductase [Gammaproteobacteria bacterium]